MNKYDKFEGGRILNTTDRRANTHEFYSNSSSETHYHHYCQLPYRRSERGYFPNEFRKAKPPNFDEEVKK